MQVLSGAALYSMWVGEGEALLREAFQRARMASPAILFVDEVDAIVGARGCCLPGPVRLQAVQGRRAGVVDPASQPVRLQLD